MDERRSKELSLLEKTISQDIRNETDVSARLPSHLPRIALYTLPLVSQLTCCAARSRRDCHQFPHSPASWVRRVPIVPMCDERPQEQSLRHASVWAVRSGQYVVVTTVTRWDAHACTGRHGLQP
eukprot:863343-Pyramimonas_sp.AAC.1